MDLLGWANIFSAGSQELKLPQLQKVHLWWFEWKPPPQTLLHLNAWSLAGGIIQGRSKCSLVEGGMYVTGDGF